MEHPSFDMYTEREVHNPRKANTAYLAAHLELQNMEVERVMAIQCVLARTSSCRNEKSVEGMKPVWKFMNFEQARPDDV